MDTYNWDLTRIFKDTEDYNNSVTELINKVDEIKKYKGKITASSENLYDVLSLEERVSYLIEKIYVYSYLAYYSDMGNTDYKLLTAKADDLSNKASAECSFITPEILSCDFDLIKKYIDENQKLKRYEKSLEKTLRYKSHTLSEKEEKILADAGMIMDTPDDAFSQLDNVDIDLGFIKDEEGNEVKLTNHNYAKFLSSKNEEVRKSAFMGMYTYFKNHINTLSSLYLGNIKCDTFVSRTRGYKDSLERHLFPDKVDETLYQTLLKVTNNNVKSLQEYYEIKNKVLDRKCHMYDTYLNISSMPEKEIEYTDALKMVNEALKPLGEDYLEKFNHLLNSHVVDVYPKDKKRSGAYQWGVYGILPYVSLNYEKNIDSVSTLAHEMGHAMHSYLSDSNQEFLYAGYPIFLAEIASTVNEILLSNYLLNNAQTDEEKIYYIVEFLDKFKATVFRQAMFAEFEYLAHKEYEENASLTKDFLCETYYNLNKKQFGDSLVIDDEIQYEWARIPHFYTPYYVYKYATGFISALIISNKLSTDENFKDKYIKFLSSGGSDYPLELLKELGIDITNENVLNEAFELFGDKVQELKRLYKE